MSWEVKSRQGGHQCAPKYRPIVLPTRSDAHIYNHKHIQILISNHLTLVIKIIYIYIVKTICVNSKVDQ